MITEGDGWKHTFSGLEKTDDQGKEIVYTVTEDEVAGYESTVDGFTITNKLNSEEGGGENPDDPDDLPVKPDRPGFVIPKTGVIIEALTRPFPLTAIIAAGIAAVIIRKRREYW